MTHLIVQVLPHSGTMVKLGGRDITLDQGINIAFGAGAVLDGAVSMLAPSKVQVWCMDVCEPSAMVGFNCVAFHVVKHECQQRSAR